MPNEKYSCSFTVQCKYWLGDKILGVYNQANGYYVGNITFSVYEFDLECKYPFTVEWLQPGDPSCATYCPSGRPLDLDFGMCRPKLDELDEPMCAEKVLNPILASSGEKAQTFSPDFNLPGKFPLKLQRSYGSARAPEVKHRQLQRLQKTQPTGDWKRYTQPSNYTGPKYPIYVFNPELGANIGFKQWRHNYQLRLVVLDENKAAVELANADLRVFNKNINDYVPEGKKGDSLTKLSTGWQYIGTDLLTYIFDEAGQLIQINNSSGEYQTIEHNAQGLVSQVIHSSNGAITFEYDANNLLTKATLPDLSVYLYQYDARFNLTKVIYPNTKTQQYHYEDTNHPFALTGITDEKSVRYATWQYDTEGRAIASSHAGGADAGTIAYSADGKMVTVTNTHGKDKTLNYSNGRLQSVVGASCDTSGVDGTMSYIYDGVGRVASKTDEMGNKTSFTYNARGLVISKTELSGTAAAQTTSFEYHAIYPLPTKITYPEGKVVNNTYGENGRLASTEQVANGQSRLTSYSYNGLGLLSQVDGPRTDVSDITTFVYNTERQLTKVTNALNQSTEYLAYDTNGRVKQVKEPNGAITLFEYDGRGRVTKTTQASRITSYQYDAIGQVNQISSAGIQITYQYDTARRLTAIADNQGNRIEFTVDLMGNITQRDIKGSDGTIVFTQKYVYDIINRLSKTTNAALQSWINEYDVGGNLVKRAAPDNTSVESSFDALKRATQNLDQAKNATGFKYNKHNQLTKVTDALNHSTTYEYNQFGELTKQTSPDSGIATFTYDEAGNLLTKTDAKNITATYTYDALNRVNSVSYSGSVDIISFNYDNNEAGRYGIGRLTRVTDPSGSTEYAYNAYGEIVNKATRFTGISNTVFNTVYSYNLVGKVAQITYPSGRVINFAYDANSQVSDVSHTVNNITKPLASDIQYLPFGPMKSLTFGNGKILSQSFDKDFKLTYKHLEGVFDINYGYNLVSNINQITDNQDITLFQSFAYSPVARLGGADGDYGNLGYGYDAVGNRTSVSRNNNVESLNYQTDSNQLANPYVHDASGNRIQDNLRTFSYGPNNRLTETVTTRDQIITQYQYNHLGQRIKKSNLFETTYFIYDENGLLIAETDNSGKIQKEYVYFEGQTLAMLVGE